MLSLLKLLGHIGLCCIVLTGPTAAQDAVEILRQVDQLRLPSRSVEMELIVKSSKRSTTKFLLQQDTQDNSLAQSVSSKSRGEKYLFTPRGLWFFAPGSRRVLRIPPAQKLRGETVIGDITKLHFSRDYKVTGSRLVTQSGKVFIELDLAAKTRSGSFRFIKLLVSQSPIYPISAEYLLASGKPLRTARFSKPQNMSVKGLGSVKVIKRTVYIDGVNKNSSTTVTIESLQLKDFAAGHFTKERLRTLK